jgi:GNAT superfamily N-acetyltransferase
MAEDVAALVKLHTATAEALTQRHGQGPWSGRTTDKGVLFGMRTSTVFVACDGPEIVGTLRLATKKPWAIDPKYFAAVPRPLYLLSMAVLPSRQRQGVGRWCIEEAVKVARTWPADAIWLDAYDAEAGAGQFYARCGFREVGRVVYRGVPLIYFEMRISGAGVWRS